MSSGFCFREDNNSEPVWEFKYTETGGAVNTIKFYTDNWHEALEKFVQFLRGSGFFVDNDSVGINKAKHSMFGTSLAEFYSEDTLDGLDFDFDDTEESQ